MKVLFSLLLMICFIGTAQSATRSYDPTNDLFAAFGNRCKGRGPVNNTAYSDGSGLKYIAESIRDDASCKGIYGALTDIQNLNIPRLLRETYSEEDLESMSMIASDLELELQIQQSSPNPDPLYIFALKEELIRVKVNIIKFQQMPNQENTTRKFETVENFQRYSTSLFSRLKQSDECLTKNPSLAAQISAQVLGLGSTVTSGYVGSLMLATGTFIDNYVSFLRNYGLNKKIKNITNSRLGEAVACSIEGLSYTYCQARDVDTIITLTKTQPTRSSNTSNWLNAIGIIGQDMGAFMEWITLVDSGSPAGTVGRADDKKKAFNLQNDLRSAKFDIEGILNTQRRIVAQSTNKVEATKNALNLIAQKLQYCDQFNQCGKGGPFAPVFATDQTCGPSIYLYSKGQDKVRKDNGQLPCSIYVAMEYPVLPDIDTEVGPLIDNIVAEATESINILLSQVSESNPDLVISKFDSRAQNSRSARQFMTSSLMYLDGLLQESDGIAQKRNQFDLINKTRMSILDAINIIETSEELADPSDPASPLVPVYSGKKVAELSRLLIPIGDTFAIPKAMSEIINQDIDDKIAKGQIDENLATLMELSSKGSLGELIKYYVGLEAANTQSRSAKELTKANLINIADIFSFNLKERLERLSVESATDSNARESLALLCMQTLAVPELPKGMKLDFKKYCQGTVYKSIYTESNIEMNYNKLSQKDYSVKACAVYDFYRKSHLYGLKTNRGASVISRPQ